LFSAQFDQNNNKNGITVIVSSWQFFQSQKSDWSISTSQFVVNFWLHQAVNVVLYRWSRTSSRRLNKIFHELLNIRSCDVENLVLHSIARHSQPVSESHHILLTLPIYPTTT